ncbi:MAG: hypothetical protein K9K86_03845 [Pseudomonadales bacterium]|nr:hypothetical protein [Pseudomonadales bacterium]
MRWILYTLIAANLGYFAWQKVVATHVVAVAPRQQQQSTSKENKIKLLVEARDEAILIKQNDRWVSEEKGVLSEGSDQEIMQAAVPIGAKCIQFGPFVDERAAQLFVNYLLALKFKPQTFQEAVSLEPFFWAYLPPFDSIYQALEAIRALKADGVEASLISEGALKDGLSLGLFEDKFKLEALVGKLRQLKMGVEVLEKPRSYKQEWVQLPLIDEETSVAEILSKAQQRYPQIKYYQKVCKSVASVG